MMNKKDFIKRPVSKKTSNFKFKSLIRGTTLFVMSIQLLHLFSKFGIIPTPVFLGFLAAVVARAIALWVTKAWLKKKSKKYRVQRVIWSEVWRFILLFTCSLWTLLLLLYIVNPETTINYRQEVRYGAGLTTLAPVFIITVELFRFLVKKWKK